MLWLAGLPGVEISQHVCGLTAGPESGEGSSACSRRFVSPVWKKETVLSYKFAIVLTYNQHLTVESIIRPLLNRLHLTSIGKCYYFFVQNVTL